jgi:hypothetical protein
MMKRLWLAGVGFVVGGIVGAAPVIAQNFGNPVQLYSIGTVRLTTSLPVSGTITANIGTSGPLALETGGNLATLAGKDFATQTTLALIKAKTDNLDAALSTLATSAKQPGLGTAGTANANVLTVQGIAGMTKLLVTPDSVALPANQSVNVAQINGGTTVTAATGVQKVGVVGNAGAAFDAATGAAPPANALLAGGIASGATGGFVSGLTVCDNSAFLDMTTATTTQIVALVSGRKIRVCGFSLQGGGTTTATIKYGTGSNCGTGTTVLSPGWELTAQSGLAEGSGLGELFQTPVSQALCVTSSAAVNLHAFVTYTIY